MNSTAPLTPLDNEDTWNSVHPDTATRVCEDWPSAAVLFVGYGEIRTTGRTLGRYDLVLESAHGFDHFVQQLWDN